MHTVLGSFLEIDDAIEDTLSHSIARETIRTVKAPLVSLRVLFGEPNVS